MKPHDSPPTAELRRHIHDHLRCDEEKLLDFDKKAVCTIVEYGVRLTGRQKKLSTRFSEIAAFGHSNSQAPQTLHCEATIL